MLTGYGGFAIDDDARRGARSRSACPTPAACSPSPCIRGGAEDGEEWHRAGMREHKQQVFDDFAAAADWLVERGLTPATASPSGAAATAGCWWAATMTQRPDLCRAVHCAVPLLDMVRFHLFLIARLWIPEYGDPDVRRGVRLAPRLLAVPPRRRRHLLPARC